MIDYGIDPAIGLTAGYVLAYVFLLALLHKLRSPSTFVATLRDYRLLPVVLAWPIASLLIVLELTAVAGLIAAPRIGGLIATSLLCVYTAAIAINLVRGRRDIDCGCSGPALRQTLSGWLIVRNLGLLFVCVAILLPVGIRPLSLLDAITVLGALLTFALLYSAANRLAVSAIRFNPGR